MRLPGFIIIGAAKAGTTAVYWYLSEHPDVFMSRVKETNFFAYARDAKGELAYGTPGLHRFPVRSFEAYRKLFEDAGGAVAVGEASPIYLECPFAARRIHETLPGARIICGLRNPVDRAYSDYLMYLRGKGEPFDPRRDLSVDAAWAQPGSHWMQVSCYHDALRRFYNAFPRERIHIFLSEELKRDAGRTVGDIYRFVGVDPSFTPDFSTPYNVGGLPLSPLMERVFTSGAAVRQVVEPWVPKPALKWMRRLRAANMQAPPVLPPELRMRLMENFTDDIMRTAALTGVNLDHWLVAPMKQAV